MKKVVPVILLVFLLSFVIADSSVNSEIKKVTHYAQEYETGNINYAELIIYLSSARGNLNEIFGAINQDGGIIKQSELEPVLGEPQEKTKWVWVEGENREEKIDKEVPRWEKIIFDGKKISIKLEASPSLYNKKNFKSNETGDSSLIYRLRFDIYFKNPEKLNLESDIEEVKGLAESYTGNPSTSNAEALVKKSVAVEKTFEEFLRTQSEDCEDIISKIFGSENKKSDEKTIVNEIEFFEGENFEAILRLDMCDECEWNSIWLDMWINGRPGFDFKNNEKLSKDSFEDYMGLNDDNFKSETKRILELTRQSLEKEDIGGAQSLINTLRSVTEAWNQKSNDVWKEVDEKYEDEYQKQSDDPYNWVKINQQKHKEVKEIMKSAYLERKDFYVNLFKNYEKKEIFYEKSQWEKRLIENFKEEGREICDNNVDDNKNNQIDCSEDLCSGKICGKIASENESAGYLDLYCIAGTCQQKEIVQLLNESSNESLCGNQICETNESLSCAEDCSLCQNYEAIECDGNVIFSGYDENSCPLEPICVSINNSCSLDSDCVQPLCGVSACIEEFCQTTLTECREAECDDGDKKRQGCNNEELVTEICVGGVWQQTGVECPAGNDTNDINESMIIDEPVISSECQIASDCRNENDVCSNGRCVPIPSSSVNKEESEENNISEQPREIQESEVNKEQVNEEQERTNEQEQNEEQVNEQQNQKQDESENQDNTVTGNFIFNFFASIAARLKITGFVGEEVNNQESAESESQDNSQTNENSESSQESNNENNENQEQGNDNNQNQNNDGDNKRGNDNGNDNKQGNDNQQNEDEDEREEEEERRKEECKDNCERQCFDMVLRPCIDTCINEFCNENWEKCDTNSATTSCDKKCKSEKDTTSCDSECFGTCKNGGNFNFKSEKDKENFKEQESVQESVYRAGGECRRAANQKEGHIYFDGWGEIYNDLRHLKDKYYSEGGGNDWCKKEIESLEKQRKEFEKSFNEEFAKWFFETYLVSSAGDWEEHISGIYEGFWSNVEISRRLAYSMNCLQTNEIPFDYKLLNFSYESEYGSIEYWEEVKVASVQKGMKETEVITPFMKIWVFPNREFIQSEFKKAMEEHEFPGPKEDNNKRKNEEGLKQEEKEMILNNEKIMGAIKKVTGKYDGEVSAEIQIKNSETTQVIFNLYGIVDDEDILKIVPMLPEETPETDILIELDFNKVYDLIYMSEKEMKDTRVEAPEWAEKDKPKYKIKETINGIKMYLKVRDLINSAKVTPDNAKGDVKKLFNIFMKMKGDDGNGQPTEQDKVDFENLDKETKDALKEDFGEFEEGGKEDFGKGKK